MYEQTGSLEWTPTRPEDLGAQPVTVRVIDLPGGSDTFTFTVHTRAVNLPPVLKQIPSRNTAVSGTLYADRIRAEDPEDGPLTYTISGTDPAGEPIAVGPADLWIDPQLGTIVWSTPEAAHVGVNDITVTITDDENAAIQYTFPLVVSDGTTTVENGPPTIELTPVPVAEVGAPFTYVIEASDPDGDSVTFTRIERPFFDPAEMDAAAELVVTEVTPTTAEVAWTPDQWHLDNNSALHYAAVEISDGTYTSTYRFGIQVRAENIRPDIEDMPAQTVTAGLELHYDVPVINLDGDPLTFSPHYS